MKTRPSSRGKLMKKLRRKGRGWWKRGRQMRAKQSARARARARETKGREDESERERERESYGDTGKGLTEEREAIHSGKQALETESRRQGTDATGVEKEVQRTLRG
eukprot:1147512-Pleurochrysis_carterae.AAC.1